MSQDLEKLAEDSKERSPSITKEFVSWTRIEVAVRTIADYVTAHTTGFRYVFGIPRGGLIPAVMLSHLLDIPLIMDQPILHVIDGPVLIIDDIVDTGKVLNEYHACRGDHNMFVSIYSKPWAALQPDLSVWSTENWIVFPWEVS